MDNILPNAPETASGWGTRNHYFYEIINNAGKSVYMQLALSAKNIPDDLREICEKINKHFPSKQQKDNWQWRCPFVTGVPSAKMGFTNEAAFYLSFLPDTYDKYIVMLCSHHSKRNESLAEYYFRTYRHLIGKTKVAEYNPGPADIHSGVSGQGGCK